MDRKNAMIIFGTAVSLLLALSSCSSDDNAQTDEIPFSADVFHSVKGKKVAFQGLTNRATGWAWDFGDGNSSTRQNPVHTYDQAGYYTAILTATDAGGTSITKEVELALDITPYILLTGGATATDGKTWKIDGASATNSLANADLGLTPFDSDLEPLPAGVFGQLGLGSVYSDEFTFFFNGDYGMDLKDGAAFSIFFYQNFTSGGDDIVELSSDPSFPFVTARFTLDEGTTFTLNENEDYTVPTIPTGMTTYPGVATLDFTNNGFVGYLDFQRKVIVQDITNTSMRLVLFAVVDGALVPGGAAPIALNSNALVLTFTAVE